MHDLSHPLSLDRTNVVQSTFAKWSLTQQLRQAGVLDHKEMLDQHEDFIYLFRNGRRFLSDRSYRRGCCRTLFFLILFWYSVWADNADVISKAYSGTGALKTDYTR